MSQIIKNNSKDIKKNSKINDEDMLNDVIISFKHLVSSYAIALNEASNRDVYNLFFNVLKNSSKNQANLFDLAFKKGWYSLESAQKTKVDKAYGKFNKCLNELVEKNS